MTDRLDARRRYGEQAIRNEQQIYFERLAD
jgi:hypothetical protein